MQAQCACFVLLAIGCVFLSTPTPFCGQQHPTVSSTSNLVQLTVTFRDQRGRPIDDLRADEVVVRDNGKVQKIRVFESPVERWHSKQLTNGSDSLRLRETNHCLLIAVPGLELASRKSALRVIHKFGEEAWKVHWKIRIIDAEGATAAIDTAAALNEFVSERHSPVNPGHESRDFQQKVTSVLAEMQKCKYRAFVIFEDYYTPKPDHMSPMPSSASFFVRAALDADTPMYVADGGGPIPVVPWGDASTSEDSVAFPGFSTHPGPVVLNQTTAQGWGLWNRTMEMLSSAQATGGLFKDAAHIFDQIQADEEHSYVLGYYPEDLNADGNFHSISVETKRSRVIVRTRAGYFAPIRRY